MQLAASAAVNALQLCLAVASLSVWWSLTTRTDGSRPWIELRRRLAVPWSGWDVILLAAATLLIDMAIGVSLAQRNGDADVSLSMTALLALSIAHGLWLAVALWYLAQKAGALADDLGFEAGQFQCDLKTGVMVFLAAALPVYVLKLSLTWLLEPEHPLEHPLVRLIRDQHSVSALVVATVSAVIVAPIYEEFLFRVLLQGWLEKLDAKQQQQRGIADATPGNGPIIFVSVLFGLAHLSSGPADTVALCVLGLFLGYAYRQTHRIYASLVVHMLVNALAVFGLWMEFLAGT